MDRFEIEVIKDNDLVTFEVLDFAHHEEELSCKFEIFRNGRLVASFEPDSRGFLHICKNVGEVDEETLHLIADKLENMHT